MDNYYVFPDLFSELKKKRINETNSPLKPDFGFFPEKEEYNNANLPKISDRRFMLLDHSLLNSSFWLD